MTNTTDTTEEAAVIGLADNSDIFATVKVADLIALLEVAAVQMDAVTEEEAEGYGLTLERCSDLHSVAQTLILFTGVRA